MLCPTVCWFKDCKDCKYRVKRLLRRYGSGCLCTNVVMISPPPRACLYALRFKTGDTAEHNNIQATTRNFTHRCRLRRSRHCCSTSPSFRSRKTAHSSSRPVWLRQGYQRHSMTHDACAIYVSRHYTDKKVLTKCPMLEVVPRLRGTSIQGGLHDTAALKRQQCQTMSALVPPIGTSAALAVHRLRHKRCA